MTIFPGGYGTPVTAVSGLATTDSFTASVGGAIKPVRPSALRGCAFIAANTGAAYTATRTILNEDFLLTVTANTTVTLAGGGIAGEMSVWNIVLKEDATGGRTITVSGVVWLGGTPTFVTTANSSNHCSFWQHGTGTIYGAFGGSATS